jgi:hypothetical protein
LAVTALIGAAVYWYLAWPAGPSYRSRSAAWWADQLERGRNRDVISCGQAPFIATLPSPVRRLVPVTTDPDGVSLLLGDPAAAPVLLALLRHPDARTRAFAAVGLGAIQSPVPGLIAELVVAAKDEDANVREAAVQSLGTVRPATGIAVGAGAR